MTGNCTRHQLLPCIKSLVRKELGHIPRSVRHVRLELHNLCWDCAILVPYTAIGGHCVQNKHFGPAPVKCPPTCHELEGISFDWFRSSSNSPVITNNKNTSMSHRYDPKAIMNLFLFNCPPVSSPGEHHCFSSLINNSSALVLESNLS